MADIRVTLRIPEELLCRMKLEEPNVSEAIRNVLEEKYKDKVGLGVEEHKLKEAVKSVTVTPRVTLPVGDVICYGKNPQTQLWWCPPDYIKEITELTREWCNNGFKLRIGSETGGTWLCPEVITDDEQERRIGGRFGPSCKGVSARVGDRLVWLEIDDAEKALDFMQEHSDIPCAVRCDVFRYGDDRVYQRAFDTANDIFVWYYQNGRPKEIKRVTLSDEDMLRMYDL